MTPTYTAEGVVVYHGDALDVLATLDADSVDAVVTDPPYLLGFMGRAWDTRQAHEHLEWHGRWAAECLRVLKPGGHLLAFGGSRTWHRLACAIEDAGFELRDSIAWLYGSGFPKSLDVSKAIDNAAGVTERPIVGEKRGAARLRNQAPDGARDGGGTWGDEKGRDPAIRGAVTDDVKQWQGWGTALKPAHEPIVVARKSPVGTVAANVLEHGTGALNIDGCRVDTEPRSTGTIRPHAPSGVNGILGADARTDRQQRYDANKPAGRWPTNVVLDETQAEELDRQSGVLTSGKQLPTHTRHRQRMGASGIYGASAEVDPLTETYGDSGGASRFFPTFRYEAKAPTTERPRNGAVAHPTVKPLDLMRWLIRLVTPPAGLVLDPFLGSGTTAEACIIEGFRCIGIEREADYLPLIEARLSKPIAPVLDFGAVS